MDAILDYSSFLTLLRDQGPYPHGGCGGMATMHAFDIQMKRIAPYTPDASYAFNAYVFNDSAGNHNGHDPRIQSGLNQLTSLKSYGCCPETSFRTNYDPPNADYPNEPAPSDSNFEEAKRYLITEYQNDGKKPNSIDELKEWLNEYGPLIILRAFGREVGHVITIIGYNDNTQMIKYVNSQPSGIQEFSYDYLMERFNTYGATAKWLSISPQQLVAQNPEQFTARIKVTHLIGRRFLTIKIGVEDQEPLIVWDRNCQINMKDTTKNLTIDVPLPDYASQFWPPKCSQWFVDVTDSSPADSPEVTGYVEDIILVQRFFNSDGSCSIYEARPFDYPSIVRGSTLNMPCHVKWTNPLFGKKEFNKWVDIMLKHFPHWDPTGPLPLKQGISK